MSECICHGHMLFFQFLYTVDRFAAKSLQSNHFTSLQTVLPWERKREGERCFIKEYCLVYMQINVFILQGPTEKCKVFIMLP